MQAVSHAGIFLIYKVIIQDIKCFIFFLNGMSSLTLILGYNRSLRLNIKLEFYKAKMLFVHIFVSCF